MFPKFSRESRKTLSHGYQLEHPQAPELPTQAVGPDAAQASRLALWRGRTTMSYAKRTFSSGDFFNATGTPADGYVTLKPTYGPIVDETDHEVLTGREIYIELDENGQFSEEIAVTDDPNLSPSFGYVLQLHIKGAQVSDRIEFLVPTSPDPLYLSDVLDLPSPFLVAEDLEPLAEKAVTYPMIGTGVFELQPMRVIAHSWGAADTNATPGTRFWQRIANRFRMGTVTNTSVSGRTIGDLSNLALSGANAWAVRTKALVTLVCTINDRTLFGLTTAARAGYRHAWRSLLSLLTANGVVASNTSYFSFVGTWIKETVVGVATDAQGQIANSTGGVRWKTTTVGDYYEFTFTGTAVDAVLVARAGAGAGLVTFTEGATSLGSLDLTQGTAQDCTAIFPIRGLAAGNHNVRATLTSGASLTVDSYRIPSTAPVPIAVLGEPPVIPKPADIDPTHYAADVEVYKSDLATVVAEFPSAKYVDLNTPSWNPATMLVTDADGGHKHPNDAGCAYIAGVLADALRAMPYSQGLNITTSPTGYPAAYAPPAGPDIAAGGGQDGTGFSGVAVAPDNTQFTATWPRIAAPAGTTDWSVRYRTSAGPGAWVTTTVGGTTKSKVVTGLTNGTSYDVQVAAVIGATVQPYSLSSVVFVGPTSATENFNGADSATSLNGKTTTTGGLVWQILGTGSTAGINGNRGYVSAGGNTFLVVDTGRKAGTDQGILALMPAANIGGFCVAASDENNGLYISYRESSVKFTYSLVKRIGGTPTTVVTTDIAPAVNDVISWTRSGPNGESVSVRVNGTEIMTYTITDAVLYNSTKRGVYANPTANGTGYRFEDMSFNA